MKKSKNILLIIGIVIVSLLIIFLTVQYIRSLAKKVENPIATMEIENYGIVKIELYPEIAPNTVANFVKLANNGFYDGLTFHRTIPEFMIQGGDKAGNGSGTATYADLGLSDSTKGYGLIGEFFANGITNKLKHSRGVISMARSDYSYYSQSLLEEGYNSASSQFFIMTKDSESLDGSYASFGKVLEGMDVVDAIANTKVHYRDSELAEGEEAPKDSEGNAISSDTPVEKPVIKSIKVETNGVDYGNPKVYDAFDLQSWYYSNYSQGN